MERTPGATPNKRVKTFHPFDFKPRQLFPQKTKTNMSGFKASQLHSGQALERISLSTGKPTPRGALRSAPIVVQESYTSNIGASSGLQNSQSIAEFPTMYSVLGSITASPAYSAYNPFDLIPSSSVTNSTLYSAAAEASMEKLYMKSVNYAITLVNGASIGAEVDLYILKAKKNVPSLLKDTAVSPNEFTFQSPEDVWTSALASEGYTGATESFSTTVGTKGNLVKEQLGASPGYSKLFKDHFQILRVKKCPLAPMGSCKLNIHYKMNKVLDYQALAYANHGTTGTYGQNATVVKLTDLKYARFSTLRDGLCIMAITRGTLCKVTNAGVAAVATSSASVLYQVERRIHYGLMRSSPAKWRWAGGVSAHPANTPVSTDINNRQLLLDINDSSVTPVFLV